ncbi:MAG TPA: pyridoxamine 5'-phosphate oxidase family protein [Actinomycetota bacterium]|nr:pyridoxamine 5'-phosphate oxidase family protein [Actinomycetota bacterium]
MQTVEYRAGLEVLGRQECLQLLASHPVGSVAIVVDGSPTIFPVQHHVVDSDTIVFRSDSTKLPNLSSGVRMSLEVDGIDDTGRDWTVAVHGIGREIVPAELARLRELGLEPSNLGSKGRWIPIVLNTIAGRRIGTPA